MKKLLAIALCAGIFTNAKSQIYVQGGVNLANISTSNSGSTEKNNMDLIHFRCSGTNSAANF